MGAALSYNRALVRVPACYRCFTALPTFLKVLHYVTVDKSIQRFRAASVLARGPC
jgi:hypothetical protein